MGTPRQFFNSGLYLGAAKALMKMLGVDVGPARLPQANPDTDQVKALHADIVAMDFFNWSRRRPDPVKR